MLGCSDDAVEADLGLDFYPMAVDAFWIYEVTETTYVDRVETIESYQLRESFFRSDTLGDLVTFYRRIERRQDDTENWNSIGQVALRQTNQRLEYQDANQIFIRMTYPIRLCETDNFGLLIGTDGRTCREWDGNSTNTGDAELIHYEEPANGDFSFENAEQVKVVISDLPANFVKEDMRFELYARNIGLVERNFTEIEFCTTGCSEANERENGYILVQRLIAYGTF